MPQSSIPPSLTEQDYIGLSHSSSLPSRPVPLPLHSHPPHLRLDLALALGLPFSTSDGSSSPRQSCDVDDRSSLLQDSPPEVLPQHHASAPGFRLMCADPALLCLSACEADGNAPSKHPQEPSSFVPGWAAQNTTAPSWHSARIEKKKKLDVSFRPEKLVQASRKPEKPTETSDDVPPPPKDQMIGWPPVRSYRRQTLDKPAEMFVKVNMDGITVGRKVDLNAYSSYEGLLLALEEMFQPSNCGVTPQARSKHFLLSGESDFVLTYEDREGDWMLVGDVPWSMFVSSVKRLRITRGSEASMPILVSDADTNIPGTSNPIVISQYLWLQRGTDEPMISPSQF